MCWKFFMPILPIWSDIESDFFSIWDPKIDWFLVRPFGLTFVKNNWWGVWPSCQMLKNCCWPIWAPKSGKMFRPKKQFFLNLVFGPWNFFCVKIVTNIQIVTHPYLVRLSKNVLEVFHPDISNSARYRICFFFCFFFGPKNLLIPSAAIWADVREK